MPDDVPDSGATFPLDEVEGGEVRTVGDNTSMPDLPAVTRAGRRLPRRAVNELLATRSDAHMSVVPLRWLLSLHG